MMMMEQMQISAQVIGATPGVGIGGPNMYPNLLLNSSQEIDWRQLERSKGKSLVEGNINMYRGVPQDMSSIDGGANEFDEGS